MTNQKRTSYYKWIMKRHPGAWNTIQEAEDTQANWLRAGIYGDKITRNDQGSVYATALDALRGAICYDCGKPVVFSPEQAITMFGRLHLCGDCFRERD